MSENPFSNPGSAGSGVTWGDHKGRLLVIEPKSVEQGIKTSFGDADAVRADVHVIDGPSPESFEDTLVFPKLLQSQLRSKLGQKVLGRLTTGQQKPGQSPPWLIAEPTADDIAAGTAWLNARQASTFAAPATAAPAAGQPPF